MFITLSSGSTAEEPGTVDTYTQPANVFITGTSQFNVYLFFYVRFSRTFFQVPLICILRLKESTVT